MKREEADVLIIGAGPAGSASAAFLLEEGIRPLVVEREIFPRFVIGESLLPNSMGVLEEAGLLEAVQRRNFMQKNGAVFLRNDESCDFDFSDQFSEGWKYTYQVPRADFDSALIDEVSARGAEVHFGHSVSAADFTGSRPQVTVVGPDGSQKIISARFVLDCSGYGRVLPRLLNLEKPSRFPPREALFTHVLGDRRPEGREQGKIWVCMHPEGAWIWIIPFSNGKTSVGVVSDVTFFAKFPSEPAMSLRAILQSDANAQRRLANVEFAFPPRRIAGYACSVQQFHGPGYALVGNATEFLDPIFSSGVALALGSARRAAGLLARQLRGERVDWQREYADYAMQGINTFRAYVLAWYDHSLPEILFAAQANREIMRQICSVLAGHVWDRENPYASQPERALPLLAEIVRRRKERAAPAVPAV